MQEEELIEKSKKGDGAAFSTLATQYREKIFQMILGIVKDQGAAEDLTQEAFLHAFQKLSSFQQKSKFYTWLYRIAHNLAVNFLRKTTHLKEEPFQEPIFGTEETTIDMHELEGNLEKAMAILSPNQKAVFDMFVLKKMSHKEIAAHLNIPTGTVRSRLHYARLKLRQYFEERGISSIKQK